MQKPALLFFCLVGALAGRAQGDSLTNNILTTKKLRVGLFQKFIHFKRNLPSITEGYTVRADSGLYERYHVAFQVEENTQDVYAFSDGRALYLNANVYTEANYFVRILTLGTIIYFEDQRAKADEIKNHVANSALAYDGATLEQISRELRSGNNKNPGWIIYLPDEDGEAWILDSKSLLSIFKEAGSELYGKLKADPKKEDFNTLLHYLQRFNEEAQSKKE
jgi:hypothetical protein